MNHLRSFIRRVATFLVSPHRVSTKNSVPLFLALVLSAPQAQAQLTPQVGKGLLWLQTQVRDDGALASEAASIATPLQSRSEALHTLKLLGGAASATEHLQQALIQEPDSNTEYLARRAWALGYSGLAQPALVEQLQQRQNADGGYGGAAGYASHARDTAFALRAQKEAPAFTAASVASALAYLASVRNPDGSFGNAGQRRLYTSVQALLAASAWSGQPGAADINVAGQQWLLAQRNPALQFGSANDNALALWALTGLTTQGAILQPLVDALHAEQLADGSWNGDPYVTAIALRALFRVTQGVAGGSDTGMHGTVTDASNSAVLAGVTVQVLGGAAVASDARGQFAFSGLQAGTLTLRFSRLGYKAKDVTLTASAGQNINVGNIALTPTSLTGSMSGVVYTSGGTPIAGALVAAGPVIAVTDATGAYRMSGIGQGSTSIVASAQGYKPVTANLNIATGAAYVFSPRLMESWATPPATVSVLGTVVDKATGQAIAGAAVKTANLAASTTAAGAFTLMPVANGAFSVTVSATGYQDAAISGLTISGINNIGSIGLSKLAATSTLTGTVTDAATGKPVASASVRVDGQGQIVLSGADGKYSIAGLTGTSFLVKVSASDYLARSETVTLTQPGAATADLALQPQALGDSDISFIRAETPKPAYAASDVISLDLVLANGAATGTAVQVSALVINAQNSVVHEYQASPIIGWQGLSYGNRPVTIGANSTLGLMLDWNAMRLPAGEYRVKAQAVDSSGRLVAEADAQFNIDAAPALAGGVTVDPPLAQAGAKTEISMTGDVMNSGNVTLAPGDLRLRIVLDRPDPIQANPETVVRTLFSGLPLSTPKGLRADGQGNMYTVNVSDRKVFRIAQDGTPTLLATLPTSSNPVGLALDPAGNVVVAVETPARLYQVDQQGAVTMINLGSALLNLTDIDITADGTMLLSGRVASGQGRVISRSTTGQETVLQDSGLSSPFGMAKDGAGNYVVTSNSDGALTKVSAADGAMTPFAGGISNPRGIAYGSDGYFYVASATANKIVKVSPSGVVSDFATGVNDPYDVKFDQSGNLFVSQSANHAIVKISPNGVVQPFSQGVAFAPQALRYDAAGNLWSTNGDGTLRKLDAQDGTSVVATGLNHPRGVAIDGNGDVLVVEFGASQVVRVRNGVKTVFARGLASPYGIAIDNAGDIHVTERDANRIVRFDANGNKLGVTETKLSNPHMVKGGFNGDTYLLGNQMLSRLRNGAMEVLQRNFPYTTWVPDSANAGLVAISSNSVVRVSDTGVATTLVSSLAFAPGGLAIAPDGAILLLDSANLKVHKLASNGSSLSLYATLPGPVSANQMHSDGAGNVFVRMISGAFQRILADGALVPVIHAVTDPIHNWSVAGNGQLVVWTAATTYRIDALVGATSVWLAGRGGNTAMPITYATGDNQGNLLLVDSAANAAYKYSGSGAESARYTGFTSPLDIIWTGSELRFSTADQRLHGFTPGADPVAKMGKLPASYLAQVGNDTLGSSSNTIYKWTGAGATGNEIYTTLAGMTAFGIAGRSDGGLAIGDFISSRVLMLNSSKVLVKDFTGLVNPQGMIFDNEGRLYVANHGSNTIARFASASSAVSSTFAKIAKPVGLGLDGAGQVVVATWDRVSRLGADGAESAVTPTGAFTNLLWDGSSLLAVDYANSQLRKLKTVAGINSWSVLAAGLSQPVAVRSAPDGGVYILSERNNSLVKHTAGKLESIASVPAGMNIIELGTNGVVTVAGNAGMGVRIGADRVVRDLNVSVLNNHFAFGGMHDAPNGKLYAVAARTADQAPRFSAVLEISTTAPAPLPQAGTVVHQTSVPMAELEANGSYAHYDFGKWVAPYGGDFKVEIYRDGVAGILANFVHVGPGAEGKLSAASTEVPPGDSELPMCMALKGADSTSVSRVEIGQVRLLGNTASIGGEGFPLGLAADKAGEIYFTSKTALLRTSVGGANTVIAGGLDLGFGLVADSDENFYVASRNASTKRYELLRIDLAGRKTVLADLGVTAAGGVQINSKNEVLVGSPNKLLKVDRQGVVTIVTTSGLSNPIGLAIDGLDNIYVQNLEHKISMIKPDGTTTSIYSKGDGVIDPLFEGENSPTIAGDCAGNLYIAPVAWARVNLDTEEHVLAQVVPHTGQLAALFDTTKVDSRLTDIDYLAYDRFAKRLLMWNHAGSQIWQVPVTCGAIGVQAHLVSHPGQTLSGANRAPSITVPRADGSTEYVWDLRDVGVEGAQVCFSTNQNGFKLGEERKAIGSGFISFQNSFAAGDVTVPLAVPKVRAANLLTVTAVTDKPEYLANEYVQVMTTLVNTNPVAVTGELRVDLVNTAGVQVASVVQQTVTMRAGETLVVDGAYNIGAALPGNYTVRAVLTKDATPQAQSTIAFKLVGDQSQASAVSTLALDKQKYAANERMTISSRAKSQSANLVLSNLTLSVKVVDQANAQLYAKTYQINQLAAGRTLDFGTQYQLRGAAAGSYRVVQTLLDAEGRSYGTQTATFTVGASTETGDGLVGAVDVSPNPVRIGESAAVSFNITNKGNSAQTGLSLMVRIVDPVKKLVIAEFPYTQGIAVGANYAAATGWIATGAAGDNLVAVLIANVGDKPMTLASHRFSLLASAQSPVKLDVKQAYASDSRVLVLVSCNDEEQDAVGTDGKPPVCETQRTRTIDEALTTLGVPHKITTSEDAFTRAFRSGLYNTYWVSGKQDKLHNDLPVEIREATFGGDGLILDGVHDSRNKVFDTVTGIKYKGKIGEVNLPIQLTGPMYEPQRLATVGRGQKPDLLGSTQQAVFDGSHPNSNGPGIISNAYGSGHAVLFAFDLASSLEAQDAWLPVLGATLKAVRPAQLQVVAPGSVMRFKTSVANQAGSTDVDVSSTLPSGAVYLDASLPGTFDPLANRAEWRFNLGVNENADLYLSMRAPVAVGGYSLDTVVKSVANGVATAYGDKLAQPFSVKSAAQTAVTVKSAMQALPLSRTPDRKARDRALAQFDAAMVAFNRNTADGYGTAIQSLLQVTDMLAGLAQVDTSATRLGIDRILREAQWRWSAKQAAQ